MTATCALTMQKVLICESFIEFSPFYSNGTEWFNHISLFVCQLLKVQSILITSRKKEAKSTKITPDRWQSKTLNVLICVRLLLKAVFDCLLSLAPILCENAWKNYPPCKRLYKCTILLFSHPGILGIM